MRRLLACTVSALAVWPAVASAAVESSRNGAKLARCSPRKARVLQASRQAVIYEGPNGANEGLPEWFGCARSARRAYLLGSKAYFSRGGGGGVEMPRLAGAIVAYGKSTDDEEIPPTPSSSSWLVIVRDLKTGRIVHKVPTGPSSAHEVGRGPVVALVAKSDGAVAWISGSDNAQEDHEVHVLDRAGERLVAAGPGIAPSSLKLDGRTVSWTQAGRLSSATLG
jgi:hypothetical protein